MQQVLIIDNYDSFTYNLVHYLEGLDCAVTVVRNDELDNLGISSFSKIVISPGSGLPKEAGQLNSFIKKYAATKSILGICLGQQAIAEIFGGELIALTKAAHGVSCSTTHLDNDRIYIDIPKKFDVGLYHSWHTVNLPKELEATAYNSDGIVMSLKHISYDLRALQYHPESIMTPFGKQLLKNWVMH